MRRAALLILPLLLAPGPAEAHRLKVFATVTGDSVSGYAFFVGGGRARGSAWVATDAAGQRRAEGTTDAEGRFRFARPEGPATALTVTVDTGDAHVAAVTLPAERLGAAPLAAVPTSSAPTSSALAATADTGRPAAPDRDADLAAMVETAVQAQVAPVLERLEAMDARLRLVDVLSAVFLILGLAGGLLWARNRRS